MTATPQQVVIVAPQPADPNANTGIIPVLPQAVTPTPIRIDPGAVAAVGTADPGATIGDPAAEGTPLVDVGLRGAHTPADARVRRTNLHAGPARRGGTTAYRNAQPDADAAGNADRHLRTRENRADAR